MPPAWVAQGLADVLGLDLETINAVIIPDLEGYASEARLRAHLTDFLGTAAPARAFTDKYVAYRFPALAPARAPVPAPAPAAAPRSATPPLVAPAPVHASSSHAPSDLKSHIRADLGIKKKKRSTAAAAVAASLAAAEEREHARASSSATLPEALESAFGPGGKVYQKSRDDDFPSRGGSARGGVRTPVSGAHTPSGPSSSYARSQTPRSAGAVTITESSRIRDRADRQAKEEKIWDLPRSDAVKRLDAVVAALRAVQAGDKSAAAVPATTPPCFCQARLHDLSRYTPQCGACGLILCELQPAHAPCPSCARPTLSPPALARLILRVEGDIAAQFAREQDERDAAERARKERLLAESGGGAFPTLAGKGKQPAGSTADAARRVLTIKSGGSGPGKRRGKATLTTTTYTPVPAASSSTQTPEAEPQPEIVPRPRSPPLDARRRAKETNRAREWALENDRPWGDRLAQHHGDAWDYIEAVVLDLAGEEGTGRRRKAKAKKGLGVDGRVVPGAA